MIGDTAKQWAENSFSISVARSIGALYGEKKKLDLTPYTKPNTYEFLI